MEYIRDLRDGMRKLDVEGRITEMGKERKANQSRVAECTLEDKTGRVKLVLWDEQIDQVAKGARVKVEKGYTSSYKGELQLNVGKYGVLTVLETPEPGVGFEPTKKLDSYYSGVLELVETDLAGANQMLKQGWQLESIKEKHVSVPSPQGITHESAVVYVLSRRAEPK